ncbi:MAG: TetR/AcrR family transcriptional regulator [Oscillospiraceae bacterium]|nr:TetR/AcrR family transcriptional regulator [Oscillospiraceae bacterium]
MNEKFFSLPEEKQRAILNAGYRVFSRNSYKKSPVSEIADAAGISKSLLFHYFRNKKELYLYLWDTAARTTLEYLAAYQTYEQPDVFATMRRGLQAKTAIMRRWPDMGAFTIKAYYEKDPEVYTEIQESVRLYGSFETNGAAMQLDPADYRPGLDLEMMYQDMFWASEGYVWENLQKEVIDVDRMEADFGRMIDFWEQIYGRNEG